MRCPEYVMHPKKLESIANLSPRERANYFLRRVADFEELWGFSTDELFYIWPEPEFVEKFFPEIYRHGSAQPHRISLGEFMRETIPKALENDLNISVFLGPDEKSWIFSPKEMKEALEEELKQYM